MSTFIPPTTAATKSAEENGELSGQDSFNHLLFKVLRLTSEQVQDLNDWMIHRGTPNVHEVIVQSFRRPHALKDDLHFIRENKTCYIKANVMISLSKPRILDHSTTSRLILKTMMSGVSKHMRRKYTSKHPPSLDLLPHQGPWQPHRHLNPTSPLPTSKRGSKGMHVPTPSSRMKDTTTLSFVTLRQLPRHKD